MAAEIEHGRLPAGTLRGAVTTRDGKAVREPVVVVAKQGTPYAWSFGHDGRYEMMLPVGDYEIYATGKGYSQGKPIPVKITANSAVTSEFC